MILIGQENEIIWSQTGANEFKVSVNGQIKTFDNYEDAENYYRQQTA